MKYIRTKDGRIIDISGIPLSYKPLAKDVEELKKKGLIGYCDGVEITKFADTIEELCDALIGTFGDNSFPHISTKLTIESIKDNWKDFYNTIYGAIWTDKGLIYVAKMNEKGELELL